MDGALNRYFIELRSGVDTSTPRYRETELRRETAAHFIAMIGGWLRQHDLDDKVMGIAITALGQVHITCDADVIDQMQHEEDLGIAVVRQGALIGHSKGHM